jgi:hypothetical protein
LLSSRSTSSFGWGTDFRRRVILPSRRILSSDDGLKYE